MAATFAPDASNRTFAARLSAAFERMIARMAEASPTIREIERLNGRSDAELARRGVTRDGEMRRILRFYGTI